MSGGNAFLALLAVEEASERYRDIPSPLDRARLRGAMQRAHGIGYSDARIMAAASLTEREYRALQAK